MLSRLLENWPYKLAAVLIAIALRFYVAAQLNPHTSMTIPVRVSGLPSNLVLGAPLGSVRVDLSGPSSDLDTLRPSDIVAEVDLSNSRTGKSPVMPISIQLNHDLPPDVRSQIKLDGPTPPTVVVTLEPLITQPRRVHVHYDRVAPVGYVYGVAAIGPSAVTVQARQDIVAQVATVTADIVAPDEIPGTAPTAITGEFDVVARSLDGHVVDGVIINPAQVHVIAPLVKAASTKVVSVNTTLIGTPAAGGRVVTAAVTPSQITLSGSPEALAKVGAVMTRPVDVTGQSGIITRNVEIIIPPGLARTGTEPVTVEIGIESLATGTAPSAVSSGAATH